MAKAPARTRRTFVPGGHGGAIRQQTIDELELVIDNFAGGGGASTGIALALGRSVDVAINHDKAAIAMHEANHPDTKHYCESVWDVDPLEVTQRRPVGLAWFSPDCTHFSKAKGGKPRDKSIRGLAWVVLKWAALVRPRVINLENVEEFITWGPLDEHGYPLKELAGETFDAFVACLTTGLSPDHPAWAEIREVLGDGFPYHKLEEGLGYQVEWRELRACDFGAPTIRKRLFLVARCDGRPIVWPQPTHGDPRSKEVQVGKLKPWRTAAEIIDWSIPCPSIFERERPLAENTLKRIARGIKRFVIDNPNPFVVRLSYMESPMRERAVTEPIQTATAKNDLALVTPYIVRIGQTGYGGDRMQYPIEQSVTTITSKAEHILVEPTLVQAAYLDRQFTKSVGQSVTSPVGTVVAGGSGKTNLVTAFLAQYHSETASHDARGQTLDRPVLTVDTANRYGLVAANLIHLGHGEEANGKKRWSHGVRDAELPLNTVTASGAAAGLVTSHLIKMYGTTTGQRTDEPVHTVTAGGFHLGEVRAFLLKYYGSADNGQSVDEPLHTATSKARFGLVTIAGEDYQIIDIGMRMLEPRELFNAQGFPEDYIIDVIIDDKRCSKASQIARCGNAVPPVFAEALVRANLPELCEQVAA